MARSFKDKDRDTLLVARRRAMGGLAFFRHMLDGQMPQAPMTRLLKMRLLEVGEGRVVFGAKPSRAHYNGMGVVHGGFAATLLDSALGCAINTMAPPGKIYTTLELKINFIRPALPSLFTAEAWLIHLGSRTAVGEAEIMNEEGKLIAKCLSSLVIIPDEPAPAGSGD